MSLSIEDEARYIYIQTLSSTMEELNSIQDNLKSDIIKILKSYYYSGYEKIKVDLVNKSVIIGEASIRTPCIYHTLSIPEIPYLDNVCVQVYFEESLCIKFEFLSEIMNVVRSSIVDRVTKEKTNEIEKDRS